MPGSNLPKIGWFDNMHFDKLVHLGIFSFLTFLLYLPYQTQWRSKKFIFTALAWAIAALAYGIIIEFVQKNWVPHRSFDLGDIIADAIGSFLTLFLIRMGWLKSFRKAESIGH